MKRRTFLLRALGALAGTLLARRAGSQALPPPDSLGTRRPADSLGTRPGGVPADTAAADTTARARPAGPSLLLAVAGDTTLGYDLEEHADELLAAGTPRDQIWPLYARGVREVLESADLALVNLECPFTERGEKLPKNFNFRARPELVEILKQGGVGVVTLANNHLMDYGREGLDDTIATLHSARISCFGAGRNLKTARRALILARNHVRIGFLGYYFQASPDMLEPAEVYATPQSPGVAGCYEDLDCMREQVQEDVPRLARKVDAVVPYFHWGKEGSYEARDYQIELAHLCVDLGARAVLGAHPHRLQGVEVYQGAPIFYSLGNFIFGGIKDPEDKLSMIVRLRIGKSGAVESELVPIQITRWPEAPFQPFVLQGEEKAAALARIAELSRGFAATLPQLGRAG